MVAQVIDEGRAFDQPGFEPGAPLYFRAQAWNEEQKSSPVQKINK
jgi:hypothetical protein